MYHLPVMLKESVDGLDIKPEGVYVDVTFGGGGHSAEILRRLQGGKLIAFDQDPDAKKNAEQLGDARLQLIETNFRYLKKYLKLYGHGQVDGILADLGISSHQIDEGNRGFSIRFDAPLDMRMDKAGEKTAKDVVNNLELEALTKVLREYGEVKNAWPLANGIVAARASSPIETTGELVKVIEKYAPRGKEFKYEAQVFQAIRIEVNNEMDVLKDLLKDTAEVLKPGGRLVVISYHSLEDRLVKHFVKHGNFEGTPQKDFYGNPIRPFKPLKSKPITASIEEINKNNRARSAKLRMAEKI